ncbi:MAG: hypothetical protein WDW38_002242 [Sanguina aurantia]
MTLQDQQPGPTGADEFEGYTLDDSDFKLLPADGGYQGYDYAYDEDTPTDSSYNSYSSQNGSYSPPAPTIDWNEARELELDRLSNLEDLMGSSGLGRVDAVQQLRQRQAEATRQGMKKDVREGGSVSRLASQAAADGYDLQGDWEALEVKNTTTGAGRLGGSRAAAPGPLLQPPSSPKIPLSEPAAAHRAAELAHRSRHPPNNLLRPNGSRASGRHAEGSLEAELESAEMEPGGRYRNLEDGFLKGMRAALQKPELSGRPAAPGAAAAAALRDVLMKAKQSRLDAASASSFMTAPPPPRAARPAPAGLGHSELADMMDAIGDGNQDFDDFYTGSSGVEFDPFYTTSSTPAQAVPKQQQQQQQKGQSRFPSTPAWAKPTQSTLSGLDDVFGEGGAGQARVSQQWATPELVSKPGASKPAANRTMPVVDLVPPPPARPAASTPTRQALREDASALQDMLSAPAVPTVPNVDSATLGPACTMCGVRRRRPVQGPEAEQRSPLNLGHTTGHRQTLVPAALGRRAQRITCTPAEMQVPATSDEAPAPPQQPPEDRDDTVPATFPPRLPAVGVMPPGLNEEQAHRWHQINPASSVCKLQLRAPTRSLTPGRNASRLQVWATITTAASNSPTAPTRPGPDPRESPHRGPLLRWCPNRGVGVPASKKTAKAVDLAPPPAARPVKPAPSRQSLQEDASAMDDMLAGGFSGVGAGGRPPGNRQEARHCERAVAMGGGVSRCHCARGALSTTHKAVSRERARNRCPQAVQGPERGSEHMRVLAPP